MKNSNRYSLAMLPLLSILAMSPSVIQSNYASRGIASLPDNEIEKIEIEKVKPEIKLDNQIIIDKEKVEVPKISVEAPKDEPKKDDSIQCVDKAITESELPPIEIEKQKIDVPDLKIQVDDIKPEIAKIDLKDDSDLPIITIEKQKIDVPELKIHVDDIKPKIEPIKLGKIKLSKHKKIHKHEKEDKEEVCDQDDKVKVLSSQVEALVASQNQIMQSMMNMTQMMMMQSMMIQQQMMMSQMNSRGTEQSPYQYANQTTAGNWVYYPQGYQPSQPNIFAQPQAQQGIFPNQMQAPVQSSWNLQPGTFGPQNLSNGLGFNMGQSNGLQMGMPQVAGSF